LLGEAYYGAKDYKKAIDAYDKVELDYPRSEKVPAAILKKGYAYLALKDKKRHPPHLNKWSRCIPGLRRPAKHPISWLS